MTTPDDETTASAESAFNLGLQRVRQGDLARAAEAYRKAIEFGDAEWATKATNGGKGFPDDRCACVGAGDVWLRGRGDEAEALSHSVNFTAAPTSCSTPAVTASTRNSEPTW